MKTVIPRLTFTALLSKVSAPSCDPQSKPAYQAETAASTSEVRTTWDLEVTWVLGLLFTIAVLI